jgi:tRNA A37 methylthiotransferase MiaB
VQRIALSLQHELTLALHETEKYFQTLLEFIGETKFERLGVFTYSFEPDTPAAKLPDHLSEEMKNERRDRLMEVQQDVAFEWNEAQIGRKLDVILERLDHRLAESLARAHGAAGDEATRKNELKAAKTILSEYLSYVKSEPLISQIDANPFGVQTHLRQVLSDSLTHLAQAIGR